MFYNIVCVESNTMVKHSTTDFYLQIRLFFYRLPVSDSFHSSANSVWPATMGKSSALVSGVRWSGYCSRYSIKFYIVAFLKLISIIRCGLTICSLVLLIEAHQLVKLYLRNWFFFKPPDHILVFFSNPIHSLSASLIK